MSNAFNTIVSSLDAQQIPYQLTKHEPVYTMEGAQEASGIPIEQAAKSLVIKNGNEFILVVLPGDARLDSKKVKANLGAKKFRFATTEEIEGLLDCRPGACHPFGNLFDVRTVFDLRMKEFDTVSTNPASHEHTLTLRGSDLLKAAAPEFADIAE